MPIATPLLHRLQRYQVQRLKPLRRHIREQRWSHILVAVRCIHALSPFAFALLLEPLNPT